MTMASAKTGVQFTFGLGAAVPCLCPSKQPTRFSKLQACLGGPGDLFRFWFVVWFFFFLRRAVHILFPSCAHTTPHDESVKVCFPILIAMVGKPSRRAPTSSVVSINEDGTTL